MSNQVPQTSSFSACEPIAAFYEALNVQPKKSIGPLGGKTYTWDVNQEDPNKQTIQVRCQCKVSTLGYGVLSGNKNSIYFNGPPTVDPQTGKTLLNAAFSPSQYVIQLPVPKKK